MNQSDMRYSQDSSTRLAKTFIKRSFCVAQFILDFFCKKRELLEFFLITQRWINVCTLINIIFEVKWSKESDYAEATYSAENCGSFNIKIFYFRF